MPQLYTFFAAMAFYLVAVVFLVVFTFKTEKDTLWLIGIVLFVFGSILLDDSIISSFISIAVSAMMLFLFIRKGDILYAAAMALVILGGVAGSVLDNWWLYSILPIVAFSLFVKYMPKKEKKNGEVLEP